MRYLLASFIACTAAHSVITAVIGESGPQGIGLGVDASNFRNCMDVIPCQQDSPIMRDSELAANNFGSCGRTQSGGNIDTSTAIEQHIDAKMVAEVSKGSMLTLQMHQVNGDGAGPYTCGIDPSGTGSKFIDMVVTKNVPGAFGLSATRQTSFDMQVKVPDNIDCVGGSDGQTCVVRCRNAAFA